ncbi:MAG: hypothetical protein SH818_01650 [Saprospiraceae bacterium]|nr:hypothetical protein [Saprospiraceae bacterium]
METATDIIESILEKAEEYGKTNLKLTKLIALDSVSNVLSSLITQISVVLVFAMFIFVVSIGASLAIGDMLGKMQYGFFIVAGFYLIVGVVFHFLLHNWIKKQISQLLLKQVD